jgi:ATP-binding cassette subfamily B multidrug efflux pump
LSVHDEEVMGKAYDGRLMRRLIRFAVPYRFMLIGSILLLIAAQAFSAYRPKLVQEAVDNAIAAGDLSKLNVYAFYFIALLVGEFVLQYAVIYVTQLMGQRIIFDLRMKLYGHLEILHLQFFDRNPVGRLITRVTSDIESLNDMFTSGLVYLFGDIFLLLSIIVFMLTLDTRLTLVTLSVLPIIFYISVFFKTKVRIAFRDIRLKISALNSYLQENITGVSTVQIFNREKKNYRQFDALNRTLTDSHLDSVFHYAWFFPAINIMSSVAIGLLLWYGGGEVVSKNISLGTLIAFIQYALSFFRPIQDLSDKYNILQTAMASSERVFKLIDTENEIANVANPIALGHVRGEIEFKNVSFAYDAKNVKSDSDYILKEINLKVEPGQSVALVGATGAGKSTIINLVSRFYEIQRGQILIDGKDLSQLDQFELRRCMAVVLQDVFLFSGDILDNIRLGRKDITPEDAIRAAVMVGANHFIEKLPKQYYEPVQERGSTLSVGQRQLISLARALAFNPRILVLDEATSSIDTESERLLQEGIKKLMTGRTSIIIAHRLSTIRHVDQIIVMHKGRIRERGTHEELLDQGGIYFRLYQLQYKDQETGKYLSKVV